MTDDEFRDILDNLDRISLAKTIEDLELSCVQTITGIAVAKHRDPIKMLRIFAISILELAEHMDTQFTTDDPGSTSDPVTPEN